MATRKIRLDVDSGEAAEEQAADEFPEADSVECVGYTPPHHKNGTPGFYTVVVKGVAAEVDS